MGFDPGVAQEAALLTAIGMGTAFAVLLVLLVMTLLIRLTSVRINGVTAEPTEDPPSQPTPEDAEGPQDEAEARNRALAAALAVTALLAAKGPSDERGEAQ